MATCACGVQLPGRRQKCDECRATNRTGAATKTPRNSKTPRGKKPAGTPDADTADQVVYPDGLGFAGRRLWKALGHDLDTAGGVLALEACRTADRLERLDSLLAGGEDWFTLVEEIPDSNRYVVVVDKALAEVRQQQTTFKAMLVELGATRVKGNPGYGGATGTPAPPSPTPAPGATPLAEARERRRRREQKA